MRVSIMKIVIIFLLFITFSISSFAQIDLNRYVDPGGLPYLKQSKLNQISSHDTSGKNKDFISVKENETAVLADVAGPGMITRIWVTISSRDPYFLRRILLRMYWDNEEHPSVEVPIGDFFGTGFEYRHYMSQFVGMSSGGYYSYFPMPFRKNARIEIVNETGMEINSFYYQIDYQVFENQLDDDVAYFHAFWKRELRTSQEENYEVLNAEGQGHFVGLNMSMQSYNKQLWFLEGDEMVYVDGESYPSIYGTGTEDYFTGGWYFNKGEFAGPYHGLILKDVENARIAVYRFHVGDAIPFKKSLHFTIENGHDNLEVADYSSTAYWYQMEPHKPFPEMASAPMRIPLRVLVPDDATEAEICEYDSDNGTAVKMDMKKFGPDWSGGEQILLKSEEKTFFDVTIPVNIDDDYFIDLYYTKAPEYGKVKIYYDDKVVATIDGNNSLTIPAGAEKLPKLRSSDKKIQFRIELYEKTQEKEGYEFGIDAFHLKPDRKFIDEWYIIGPFPNERTDNLDRLGLDKQFAPENEFDSNKEYDGKFGNVSWELRETPDDGYINLNEGVSNAELTVFYAATWIYSEEAQTKQILFGTDDGAKLFLNGEELYRVLDIRIPLVDQEIIDLPLKKGWNLLMFKVENNLGGYGFFARIPDIENSLIINAQKEK